MTQKINWKKEAKFINSYSDFRVKGTKEGVLSYIEHSISLNGEEYLYSNEKELMKKLNLLEVGQ
jgi:hypothetical protein